MEYMDKFKFWQDCDFFDEQTRQELIRLEKNNDNAEIEDRFYKDLDFGTGGLRGIMGAGTNRMNKYTVGRATSGAADYFLDTFGHALCLNRGIVVAYDTRNNSRYFAQTASDVLSAKGIKTFLFDVPVPTPELSFAVKFFNCLGGIVITASHNPKEYNGYKVYDEYGCQLVPDKAERLIGYVKKIKNYSDINFNGIKDLQISIDITKEFVSSVLKQSVFKDFENKKRLKIVYTPLHGAGNIPVRQALKLAGFKDVAVVSEQELPDGNFSTVKSPNPEDSDALNFGIQLAKKSKADIVLGTDPDCDRVGVGINTDVGFTLLTGNQIGALLVDYVLSKKDLTNVNNPVVIKTIVTSELGAEIAKKHGLRVLSTLTGFKFIGEKITQFEKNKETNYTFVIGYEESYGYLVGTHSRDKDAVVASLLICEMAAEYKAQGKTLQNRLNEIYCEYGYYHDALESFTFEGKNGMQHIQSIMNRLRNAVTPFDEIKEIIDYKKGIKMESPLESLPRADVLKFLLADGSWIAVRPSGTEPKIKFYFSIKDKNKLNAETRLNGYRKIVTELVK